MKQIGKQLADMGLKRKLEKELMDVFLESMRDPDFQAVARHVKTSDDVLMKHTSALKDCVVDYQHCKNCKSLLACKNQMTGYFLCPSYKNGIFEVSYLPCRYKKKQLKDTAYQSNVYTYEIPSALREANMKQIHVDGGNRVPVIKWIQEFVKVYLKDPHQKGLYLHGNFGCGKTYLVSALFNKLAESGVRSAIIYYPEFLRSLKASFATNFDERFTAIKKMPLLLFDDIGAETTTQWGRDEILGPILQYRMDQKLPTFFTSNLSLPDIEEHFAFSKGGVDQVKARRVMERIKQLTEEFEMVSTNKRG